MYINPEIESSYKDNNLGITLYNWVIYLKPKVIIDFGVLNGYSTIALAMACKENGFGKVKVYDLFEKYEYTRSNLETLIHNLKEYGLIDWVEIEQKNFFDWVKNPEQFDILHLDISNTGDIIKLAYDSLKGKGGKLMFEGGSEARDRVGWMKVHNKKPINDCGVPYEVINPMFPSLSIVDLK